MGENIIYKLIYFQTLNLKEHDYKMINNKDEKLKDVGLLS